MNIKRKATIFLTAALFCLDAVCMNVNPTQNSTPDTLRKQLKDQRDFLTNTISVSVEATQTVAKQINAIYDIYKLPVSTVMTKRSMLNNLIRAMMKGIKNKQLVVYINQDGKVVEKEGQVDATDEFVIVDHENQIFDKNKIALETRACGISIIDTFTECIDKYAKIGKDDNKSAMETFNTNLMKVKNEYDLLFPVVYANETIENLNPLLPLSFPSASSLQKRVTLLDRGAVYLDRAVDYSATKLADILAWVCKNKKKKAKCRLVVRLAPAVVTVLAFRVAPPLIGGLGTMLANAVPVIGPWIAPTVGRYLNLGASGACYYLGCGVAHLTKHSGAYAASIRTWLGTRQGKSLFLSAADALSDGNASKTKSMWTGKK